MPQRVGADVLGDPGAAGYPPDESRRGRRAGPVAARPWVTSSGPSVRSPMARSTVPGGARGERDGDDLSALAVMTRGPVAAFQTQVLDVRSGRLRHAQAVELEQRDQRVPGGRAETSGDQQRADLVAIQGGGVRLIIQPRPSDARGRGVLEKLFLDRRTCRIRRWCTVVGSRWRGLGPLASSSRAKVSMSARRTGTVARTGPRHQAVNCRRSSV